jgi:hypothetical protein
MPKASSAAIYIDFNGPQGFKSFARALRVFDPELKLSLLRNLRAAGQVVKVEAQKNASYSREIPPSLKVRVSGISVAVQTPRTAIRGLEEYSPGEWDHPVFGNLPIVTQKAHPYLAPAVASKTEEVTELVAEALGAALDAVVEEP